MQELDETPYLIDKPMMRLSFMDFKDLFESIRHGDIEHQQWLWDALYAWSDHKPIPKMRGTNAGRPGQSH